MLLYELENLRILASNYKNLKDYIEPFYPEWLYQINIFSKCCTVKALRLLINRICQCFLLICIFFHMYTVGYLSKIINIRPTNQTVDVVYEPVDSSNISTFP